MDTLEEKFTKLVNKHKAEIDAKVEEACVALDEAVRLSDLYGIPFRPSISFLRNSYFPKSFYDDFGELRDSSLVYELTRAYSEYGDAGWEHSAVC